jgi:outer membrane biosynthesis protein TonB
VNYPEPVYSPSPRYPIIYHPIATERDIWVALVVDSEGRVRKAKCLGTTDTYLTHSVEHTVSKWTFTPGTVNGTPDEFLISVAVKFRWKGSEI